MSQRTNKICIYCMGDYGLETYFRLKEMGIKVSCFGDRDVSKHGYALEGLSCYSYEEILQLDKKETILVVAVKNPNVLMAQFKEHGFEYVYDKDQIIAAKSDVVKREPTTPLVNLDQIKYYKECLNKMYYENIYESDIENEDMQQIVEDLSKRRKES